jgi:hypothetical protein
MQFIELPRISGNIETVNADHIIKLYTVTYDGETFTRVIFTMGATMIDSPLTVANILHRINN